MKLALTTAAAVTLITGAAAAAAAVENNDLANCFRRCENRFSGGSSLDNCRSDCRADSTRSGRDYRNNRKPTRRPTPRPNQPTRNNRRPTRRPTPRPNGRNSRPSNRRVVDDYFYYDDYIWDDAIVKSNKGAVAEALKHLVVGVDEEENTFEPTTNDEKEDKDDDEKKDKDDDDDEKKDKDDDDDDKKDKDDDDDDKKRKDDDDDDDKKSKDDDDDDDDKKNKKRRTIILPECETDGKNYKRCDPDSVAFKDVETCYEIEDLVCDEDDMDKKDKDYCKCIGLEGKRATLLRGVEVMAEPATNDEAPKDDDKEDKEDDDDKKDKEDDDDDEKKDKDDDDDDKKSKDDDDDDDKKSKDDDDDDDDKKDKKNSRTIILPECETDGKNYERCDPDSVAFNDVETCAEIEDLVCGEDVMDKEDKDYCKCIGLEAKRTTLLRGVLKGAL